MLSFVLAILPLIIVLVGIIFFRKSGALMAVVGWIAVVVLAVAYFHTPIEVALGATAYGIVKGLGISVAVVFTMLMIFMMREVGALTTIANAMKRVAASKEEQALFIGMGFGSFVTALGAVTPALFPPLLMALGFDPFGAVSVAVLGYDPLTSFALLSIPTTLPADSSAGLLGPANAFTAQQFALKIALYLPVISVGLALAMLWVIGGRGAMRRGVVPAVISGLVILLSSLSFVAFNVVPVRIVGVLSGLLAMLTLFLYQRFKHRRDEPPKDQGPLDKKELTKALSPWLFLIAFAAMISVPEIGAALGKLPGSIEVVTVFANQRVDLDVLNQIYTWVFVAFLASLAILKPTKGQLKNVVKSWARKIGGPFVAYSVYFAIAYVMFFSAFEIANGVLAPGPFYRADPSYNMDVVVGATLASIFGFGFVYVAAALGLFGAVVGGSETASNMMFMKIQYDACSKIGLNQDKFLTVYGAHAAGGGIASSITPSKINNAVATIGEGTAMESLVMRKNLIIAFVLTILTGILTGILVGLF